MFRIPRVLDVGTRLSRYPRTLAMGSFSSHTGALANLGVCAEAGLINFDHHGERKQDVHHTSATFKFFLSGSLVVCVSRPRVWDADPKGWLHCKIQQ